MALGALVALAALITVDAVTVNQPLLSRGTSFAQGPITDTWEVEEEDDISLKADPPSNTNPAPDTTAKKPKYTRPFNLTNGACKHIDQPRYVMEIRNVAHGSYYIGKMGFGTPTQTLNLLLDTGSDEIVVKGAGCRGCRGRGYDTKKSSTYKEDNPTDDPDKGTERISYGSGDVAGKRGFDTVSTGPLHGPGMNILEVRSTTIQEFADTADTALEVIGGMAPGLPEYTGEKLASHMKVRRFAECLPVNSNENGFFVVNDDDPATKGYSGPFTSMGNYYWALGVTDFRFQFKGDTRKPIKLGKTRTFSALTDTGTTLLSVPQNILDDLSNALRTIDYDCHQMDKLPDLSFEIDGVTHKLPPNTYIAEDVSKWGSLGQKMALKDADHTEGENDIAKYKNLYFKNQNFINSQTGAKCVLLFTDPISMNSTLGEIGILGMPFFRNYVIQFDFCTRQIWTKPSPGDCSRAVGQHPSNKDHCADGDNGFLCFFEAIYKFFKNIWKAITSIFTSSNSDYSKTRGLKIVPGTERISSMAQWLLSNKGSMVEL
jgi:hypothetical protein